MIFDPDALKIPAGSVPDRSLLFSLSFDFSLEVPEVDADREKEKAFLKPFMEGSVERMEDLRGRGGGVGETGVAAPSPPGPESDGIRSS